MKIYEIPMKYMDVGTPRFAHDVQHGSKAEG